MADNPIYEAVVDSEDVPKDEFRAAFLRLGMFFDTLTEFRNTDTRGQKAVYVNGANWVYNPANTTSPDDGLNVIIDLSGVRRYERQTVSVPDGDKGDVVVSGTGTVWMVEGLGRSYATRAVVAATDLSSLAVGQTIFVRGHTIEGLGGATYIKLAAAPGIVKAWHLQSSDGSWFVLDNSNAVNFHQYGAVGNGTANDTTAILACFEHSINVTVLPGVYRVTQQILITKRVTVVAPKRKFQSTVKIVFDGVTAVDALARGGISLMPGGFVEGLTAQFSVFEGIEVSTSSSIPANFDGFWIGARAHFDHCKATSFTRDGFRAEGEQAVCNPNGTTFAFCQTWGNLNGFHTIGDDANACVFTGCGDFGATNVGFLDDSFLGCSYYGCEAGYSGVTAFKSSNGGGVNRSAFYSCYAEGATSGPAWDCSSPSAIYSPQGAIPVSLSVGHNAVLGQANLTGLWSNQSINVSATESLANTIGNASNSACRVSTAEGFRHRWLGSNVIVDFAGYGIYRGGAAIIDFAFSNIPTFTNGLKLPSSTVAALPSAATAGAGTERFVTDALAPAYNAIAVGGGSVGVKVVSNGTNWMT